MRPSIVRITPPLEDVDHAARELAGAIDDILTALLLLQPDIVRWPPPNGALHSALREDREARRAEARFREVMGRIEALLGEDHEEDVSEAISAMRDYALTAAGVGWRVGLSCARSAAAQSTATA